MKKRVFLIPALCLVFLLNACAETPTQENVVGKDRKELEEKINDAPAEINDPNPLIDEEGQDLSLEQYSFMSDDSIVQYRFTGTAKLLDVESNEEEEYQIVGSTEADPLRGSISDECPVGRAVLGKHVAELVDVEAPGGVLTYQILEISASK